MRHYLSAPLLLALILTLATAAPSTASQWDIDKAHSNFYFDIAHTFATVRGQFRDFSGAVHFDPNHIEGGSVTFNIDVASIDTNIDKRDEHLRTDDFFSAEKFPRMTFTSTGVKHVKGNQYRITGNLTIKDVTRTITAPFTFLGIRDNPFKKGQKVAGFEAEFTINRLDYNVGSGKFAQMGVVGKDVHILVALEVLEGK